MTATLSRSVWSKARRALLLLLAPLLFVACADDDEEAPAGLSRADVEGIVEADIEAAMADMPEADPGLSSAEVQEIVDEAIASIPDPEPEVTAAQVAQIVRGIAAPSKSDPSAYTKFFVDSAIAMYEALGRDATLDYYNSLASVDGPWYVFIIGPDDTVVAHYDNERLGRNANDPIYSDIHGYFYGPELLSASEEGKWVAYTFQNPGSGDISTGDYGEYEIKNSWVVHHDGMVFGSGWYITAEEITEAFVWAAAEAFIDFGIAGVPEALSRPDQVFAGGAGVIEYYNNNVDIGGELLAFTAAPDGTIVLHSDISKVGTHIDQIFGGAEYSFSSEGDWAETEAVDPQSQNLVQTRIYAVEHDGYTIASGWRNEEPQ
ncbi:MAG: hypothetical protein OXF75_09955 [Acidimicrobiaceae bacterium]|nr:hypothetical protein [Acidimicrobiaceae bacterium]